ncbi:hypothetical protein ERJ75_000948100 [Trypanosoma vivax]|uniref:Uncharacterized protein n=1 Tax=Trypanosoma vivax (strain Y486) TaxID=1055687 RepID=G0U4I5_TRYVY|nr:hypothetical protein TRVL_00607 [Trypanosoma vivax]KAH8611832.1 hypothetical protein ERJ75_000948100 [Trypanosoma vivax]CCC52349.1 conserved hypothetical protein [Trypanosoma vivax Y486]
MPIKPKRIDPERARLAARGQWKALSGGTGSVSLEKEIPRNAYSCDSGSSDTSGDSSDTGDDQQIGIKHVAVHRASALNKHIESELMSSGCGGGSSDSDPELYRRARERTRRFLYPNGLQAPASTKTKGSKTGLVIVEESVVGPASDIGKALSLRELGGISKKEENKNETTVEVSRSGGNHTEVFCAVGDTPNASNTLGVVSKFSDSASSSSLSSPVSVPLAVREALEGIKGSSDSETGRDFNRLLELFARDISRDRSTRDGQESMKPLTDALGSDGGGAVAGDGPTVVPRAYAFPPRTFSEVQERMLLEIYDTHSQEKSDTGGVDEGGNKYFIAANHMAEAFTLAALKTERRNHLEGGSITADVEGELDTVRGEVMGVGASLGAPLGLMDIVAAERCRLNARSCYRGGNGGKVHLDPHGGLSNYFVADTEVIAASAEESLNRFLLGIQVFEEVVGDHHVISEIGRFLFEHHKLFLKEGTDVESKIRSYPHEAFVVYERYSLCVSNLIVQELHRHVPNFSIEEFLMMLYDTDLTSTEDSNVDATTVDTSSRTIDILSYSAWRVLQSISSFEEFSEFMDDFIAEENGVEKFTAHNGAADDGRVVDGAAEQLRADTDGVIVTAGARGIRALLSKANETVQRARGSCLPGLETNDDGHQGFKRGCLTLKPHQPQRSVVVERVDVDTDRRADSAPGECGRNSINASSLRHGSLSSLSSAFLFHSETPMSPAPSSASLDSSRNTFGAFFRRHRRRPDVLPGRVLPPLTRASASGVAIDFQAQGREGPSRPSLTTPNSSMKSLINGVLDATVHEHHK